MLAMKEQRRISMQNWICVTCGTQYAASENPPAECPICLDQRQYIGHDGQKWTTIASMQSNGSKNKFREYEPHLTGIGTDPQFAIGQRALLIQTDSGNVLWDCISYLDDETAKAVEQRGGIKAIAISHPHFYSSMVIWAERFNASIYIHDADRKWVMRPSERIVFWSDETLSLTDNITLVRLGGHFAGSSVLHWKNGAEGKGVLLTGDTIQVIADRRWVSFMYSYPNNIPLPSVEVDRMRNAALAYDFERLYGGWFDAIVEQDAKNAVNRSADRYIQAQKERLPEARG
jgi:glyoxylase-like metal-dependent hydrolase (beta-lactamase superfamily II)